MVINKYLNKRPPVLFKYAASLLGMCKPDVRLPLVQVKKETKESISEALKVAKIL